MHYTRTKRERQRRKLIRRITGRVLFLSLGVLILMMAWNLTSFALRHLVPEEEYEEARTEEMGEIQKAVLSDAVQAQDREELLLVNKNHPLSDTYQPSLVRMRAYGVEVDESIENALNRMLEAGEKEGLTFWIASGYRSPERQRELLDEDIEALVARGYSYSEAYEEVVKETMPVGCSEHATGLCVDIVAKDYQILDEKQGRTEEIKWLQENCSQYGFILRYPEGKEEITKVSYESWHYRYVGVDAARTMMEQGITLEEYLESE